jgi:hypothetical protein
MLACNLPVINFLEEDALAFALRRVAAEHSDRPMYFVFPDRRSSSRAPMDSSSGVSAVVQCGQNGHMFEVELGLTFGRDHVLGSIL